MEEEQHEEDTMEEDEMNEPSAFEEEDVEENATEEEDEAGEKEEEEDEENGEKAIEQAKNEEKVGENSKEKFKSSRRSGRKKVVAQRAYEEVAAKLEDKPGSSSQKKVSKRAESMGMIFMCSLKTKKDCYRYKLLGLPASKKDVVQKVYKGMRLFLFDFDLRMMYGIYKAAGPGGYNIEPKAFKSAFPSQVQFTVLEDCLPLAEEKFKTVLKDNYYTRNKFDCQLTSEQVKNLCKLFVATSRGSKSNKKVGSNLRAENHPFIDRNRIRQRSLDEERHSALGAGHRYHNRPIMYERETFAPLPRLPPLPPSPPSYAAYGRTLEVDVYRRDPLVDHRDHWLLDLDLMHQDEIGSRDPYISYREPPPYRDPLYSAGVPPEDNPPAGLLAEYHPRAGPLFERCYPAAAPSDYGPLRPLYRY